MLGGGGFLSYSPLPHLALLGSQKVFYLDIDNYDASQGCALFSASKDLNGNHIQLGSIQFIQGRYEVLDRTHLTDTPTGCVCLGQFEQLVDAQVALERSIKYK